MGDDSAKCLYRSMSSSHNRMTRPISSVHASAVQNSSVDPIVSSSALDGRNVSSEPAGHLPGPEFLPTLDETLEYPYEGAPEPTWASIIPSSGVSVVGTLCVLHHREIGPSPVSATRIFFSARRHGWDIIWWHFLSKKGLLHGYWGPCIMATQLGR